MERMAQENSPGTIMPPKQSSPWMSGQMHILVNQSGKILKQLDTTGFFKKYTLVQVSSKITHLHNFFDPSQRDRLNLLVKQAYKQESLEATVPWEGKTLKLSFYKEHPIENADSNLNLFIQYPPPSLLLDNPSHPSETYETLEDQSHQSEDILFFIDAQGFLSLANPAGRQFICQKLKYSEEGKTLFTSLWPQELQGFWQDTLDKAKEGPLSGFQVSRYQFPSHTLFNNILQVKLTPLKDAHNLWAGLQVQLKGSSSHLQFHSETYLQAILQNDQLGWAMWAVDLDLKILFANELANKFTQKTQGNSLVPGTSILEYWHPKKRSKNLVLYQKALSGELVNLERHNHNPELPNFWVKINLQPIWEAGKVIGVIGRGQFNEKQKKTEAELREANAYKTTLLNSSNQGIWAVDRNYKLLFFNTFHAQMTQRILGHKPMIGDSVLAYSVSDTLQKSAKDMYDQALQGNHTIVEQCILDQEGKEVWSEYEFNPIYDDDKILGAMVVSRDITERKMTEKKLIESENSLKEAQAIASIGNWSYDTVNHKHYWSQEMRSIFGVGQDEPVPDYQDFLGLVVPQERPKIQKIVSQLINKETTSRENYRIQSQDGQIKHVLGLAKSIADADGNIRKIVGVVQDVTKNWTIELALRNQKEFLENLIHNLPIAVFVKDIKNNFRLTTWNRKCEEIYGIKKDDALGKNDFDLFDHATALRYHQNDEDVIQKEGVLIQEEVLLAREDKNVYVYQVKVPIKDIDGRPAYILGIEEDITERLQKEKELILAKEKAEEATQAKTDFLATMSHEIRTPLNAVVGITNLLIEESLQEEQLDKIQALKFSAKSLLDIINDILDYNKIEAGKVELEQAEFSLLELCRNIKQTHEYQAIEKGIQLKLILDDDIPKALIGDSTRISQILNNLVSNAVKFTETGTVKLLVHLEEQHQDRVKVYFCIQDTGIGIPLDKQKLIFERYTQSGQDTTRRFGGSGLGLAICKGLLDLLDSEIILESEPGKGSEFSFFLELQKSKNPDSFLSHNQKIQDWSGLKDARVLVAEDNPVNQFVIQGYLNKWQIDFEFANDGQEALDKLSMGNFDLILMDLQMPEMNGLDAAKKIRTLEGQSFQNIPIIALTASASKEVRNKVEQIGMNDYVSKPFQPKDLYRKMLKYYKPKESVERSPSDTQASYLSKSPSLEPNFNLVKYFEITDDDPAMYRDLLKLTFREFNNFMIDYREAMERRDLNRIRSLVHKSSPTMQLLEFNGLIKESHQGKFILKHPNPEDGWISQNIKEVEKHCLSLLNELSDRANNNSSQDLINV